MVGIVTCVDGFLSYTIGEVEIFFEESLDTKGSESSTCCNYAKGEVKNLESLAVSGGSKIVS